MKKLSIIIAIGLFVAAAGVGVIFLARSIATTPLAIQAGQGYCLTPFGVTEATEQTCFGSLQGETWFEKSGPGLALLSDYIGIASTSTAVTTTPHSQPSQPAQSTKPTDTTVVWSCEREPGERDLLTSQAEALDCVGLDFNTCTYPSRVAFDQNQPEYCTTRIRQFKLRYNLP